MTAEEKKKYLEILEELDPLLNEILGKRCGQSWWSPPGEDWFLSCDMGCVEDFIDDLRHWLIGNEITDFRYPNTILRNPPTND